MDSPQQTNDIVLGAGKVKGTRTTAHQVQIQIKKRIEIINSKIKNQSHHLIRQICQKLNTKSQFRKKISTNINKKADRPFSHFILNCHIKSVMTFTQTTGPKK